MAVKAHALQAALSYPDALFEMCVSLLGLIMCNWSRTPSQAGLSRLFADCTMELTDCLSSLALTRMGIPLPP